MSHFYLVIMHASFFLFREQQGPLAIEQRP